MFLSISGESTIIDVPLQLGDPSFGYVVTVRVYVFDRIGDKTQFDTNITVHFNHELNFYSF